VFHRFFYNAPVRLFSLVVALSLAAYPQSWTVRTQGRATNLRGVSVTRANSGATIVWASGSKGVVLRSTDHGKSWAELQIPSAENLDFRDIEAFDADTAYVMSSGDADKSRIYKTSDGGKSWALQYTGKSSGFFLDSIACDSNIHCLALSDPVDGKFLVLATADGEHWKELPRDKMPPALPTEGAFAASGTSLALCGEHVYFGTGGPSARIFRSADRGLSWTVSETPTASGNASSGIFSIACRQRSLVAVGGDYRDPANPHRTAINSTDAGSTWHLAEQPAGGYRSAVTFVSNSDLVALGTNGTDLSRDAGAHWRRTDVLNLNAVSFSGAEGWAVGPQGTIAEFNKNQF
jgi:photosystem II stability/assembly factor-like uncharacterized protein